MCRRGAKNASFKLCWKLCSSGTQNTRHNDLSAGFAPGFRSPAPPRSEGFWRQMSMATPLPERGAASGASSLVVTGGQRLESDCSKGAAHAERLDSYMQINRTYKRRRSSILLALAGRGRRAGGRSGVVRKPSSAWRQAREGSFARAGAPTCSLAKGFRAPAMGSTAPAMGSKGSKALTATRAPTACVSAALR